MPEELVAKPRNVHTSYQYQYECMATGRLMVRAARKFGCRLAVQNSPECS